MYNGDCYPNGSYFRDTAITIPAESMFPNSDYLQCVLPNSTLSGGEWSRSNGGPVDCTSNTNSDPLRCITTGTPANLTLYRPNGQAFQHLQINYTSVVYPLAVLILPLISSLLIYSVSYLIVLVHILSFVIGYIQIVEFRFELLSDMTVIPQQYTLHCVTTGDADL